MQKNRYDMLANASEIMDKQNANDDDTDLFWFISCILLLLNPKHFDTEIEKLKLEQAEMKGKLEVIENLLTR